MPPSILSCSPWILQTCPPLADMTLCHAAGCPVPAYPGPRTTPRASAQLLSPLWDDSRFSALSHQNWIIWQCPNDAPSHHQPKHPQMGKHFWDHKLCAFSFSSCPHLAPKLSTDPRRSLRVKIILGLAQLDLSPSPERFPRRVPVRREQERE